MKVISLCSGYGGIELALEQLFHVELKYCADIDPGACKILAHRYPGVPNLGDLAQIDWAEEMMPGDVDVLTAGFPCQDVSQAGGRAGLHANTRTGVWYQVARAIDYLQPSMVVLENVRGLLSAEAASAMEPCPWCMGRRGEDEPVLRALGAVLGDLADIGYDAEWQIVPASAVGAPHRRERVFVVAWPANPPSYRSQGVGWVSETWRDLADGLAGSGAAAADAYSGTERAGTVETGRGLVATVEGDQEPGRRGDRQHAAAAHTAGAGNGSQAGYQTGWPDASGPAGWPGGPGDAAVADPEWRELQRRGDAGVMGSQASGEPGEGNQRERSGDALVDGCADAPDPARERLEGVTVGRQGDFLAAEGDSDATNSASGGRQEFRRGSVEDGRQAGHASYGGTQGMERRTASADPDVRSGDERLDRDSEGPAGRWRQEPGAASRVGGASADPEHYGFAACPRCGYRVGEEPGERGSWGFAEELAGDDSQRPAASADPERIRWEGSEQWRGEDPAVWQGTRPGGQGPDGSSLVNWGQYAPAITQWEFVLGRPAPRPAEPTGRDGGLRLSPAFVEWMQGLPEGWVTQVPGLTRTQQLKALGNGVVPQQAAYALRLLLPALELCGS